MLLTDLWEGANPTAHKFIVLRRPGDDKFIHRIVSSSAVGQLLAEQAAEQGFEAYFAPSGFEGRERKQDQVVSVPAFWIDLDCGEGKAYPDAQTALAAVQSWLVDAGMPQPTHIVLSGVGLHIYWLLDAPVPREVWKPVAQRFKQALRIGGVMADSQRTADEASILRVPGTLHLKDPSNPRPVRQLMRREERVRLADFAARLPELGPTRVLPTPGVGDEWGTSAPLPPGDAAQIAESCAQMRGVRDVQGNGIEEPYWRAALSVLIRCEGGDRLIHEWSKGDPRYNPQQTADKAAGTSGPMTCATFDEANPGGCEGCPLRGKITSPIQAAPPAPVPVEVHENASWQVSKVGRFKCTSGGVYYTPPPAEDEPGDPVCLLGVPLWVREVRERNVLHAGQTMGNTLLIHFIGLDHKPHESVLPATSVYEPRLLREWMADNGIAPAVLGRKAWDLLSMYISQLAANLHATQGAVSYNEAMGWYHNFTTFVVGRRLITKDGEQPALLETSQGQLNSMQPNPNADGAAWSKAVNSLSRPGRYKHAYAVLCSMGSAISAMRGRNPALLSLAGNTGAGKTTAMKLGFSFWCDPDMLVLGPKSTYNATVAHLGARRHLPLGIDEITQYKAEQVGALAYTLTNGRPDAKQQRNGKSRHVEAWCCASIVTSNAAIMDYSEATLRAAQRARITELFFHEGDSMQREEGAYLNNAIRHHGAHVTRFVQMLIQLGPERIEQLGQQAEAELAKRHSIRGEQRFGLWQMADAWVAGALAKSLGIIDLDLDATIAVAAEALNETGADMTPATEQAVQQLGEFLNANASEIVDWPQGGVLQMTGMQPRSPVARLLGPDRIAVGRTHVNALLQQCNIPRKSVPSLFIAPMSPEPEKNVRMLPQTPSVKCYIFDPQQIGFDFTPPENLQ